MPGPVLNLTYSVAHLSRQGWGENILPGLRGTAWKEKVASIERLNQGVMSGEVNSYSAPVCGRIWPPVPI